jgi:hypothetical protein
MRSPDKTVRVVWSVLLLTVSLAAWAQHARAGDSGARGVEGSVTNSSGTVLEGAVVQLKNTKTLQVRSFVTLKDGHYQFQGLSTNADYELRAALGGNASKVKTLSTFDSRKKAIIDLKIESRE